MLTIDLHYLLVHRVGGGPREEYGVPDNETLQLPLLEPRGEGRRSDGRAAHQQKHLGQVLSAHQALSRYPR